ncbi:unnamed protein product [Acanthoscelides obtectus]|uniref:Uncharacterized protein n=1 Tax=Acanthoscelides obtectus TaxID=200917 RepID=A0A9P0M5K8_ACAOB|nr:unnamed protein product [Acanthoscelides obtectus]CAK1658527.1 hypothetical protein AOBTE_LOCUS20962 [Acanthoscelides obtectus]
MKFLRQIADTVRKFLRYLRIVRTCFFNFFINVQRCCTFLLFCYVRRF